MTPKLRSVRERTAGAPRAMRVLRALFPSLVVSFFAAGLAGAATTVPTDVQQPGTQPGEVSQLEGVSRCDNCHGNYNTSWEPWYNWSGSMMAHAGRDPIFWATMAIAEQDFDGAGDLCLRCHATEGWVAGRSTPTDGSGLGSGDTEGVQCDLCHRLTNPDDSEHLGVQFAPFFANDEGAPATGYYGTGMYVLSDGNAKLGPYNDSTARHQALQSQYHRSSELCGTCHDVSNPVVGDLAHNHGAQTPLAPGTFSGVPGSPVAGKAAFNNFPYQYGIVERTFSEHKASLLSETRVAITADPNDLDYGDLPAELRAGSIQRAYDSAQLAGNGGDYEDGTPRYFTCQTCHMRPVQDPLAQGCNKNPPQRGDLPQHDMTGGNYWMPDAIQYLDNLGKLRLGGGLTVEQIDAMNDGKARAEQNLRDAASLLVTGNVVDVVNLTAHKLISGYPEGRRMWLAIEWHDSGGNPIVTDGDYGLLTVDLDGVPTVVESLVNLHDPYTRVYEAHPAMTQQWASQLRALGKPADLALSYDRITGAVTKTLDQLATDPPGSYHETFHFVLNNYLAKDNRIPPYGMSFDAAVTRNILPVPGDQYGSPGPGGSYDYWDEVVLNPPPGAATANIELYYQPTSWEYIQFLHLANDGQNPFLADEGANMLEAWLNTGMAGPYAMAFANWQLTVPACADGLDNDGDGFCDTAGASCLDGSTPGDPGCAGAGDESENSAALVCDNRLDDDGNGRPDFPYDPSCSSPTDPTEGDPDIELPASLDFGPVPVNTTATLPLQIANVGTATLTVTGIFSSRAVFVPRPATATTVVCAGLALAVLLGASGAGRRRGAALVWQAGLVATLTLGVLALSQYSEAGSPRPPPLNIQVAPGACVAVDVDFKPNSAVGYTGKLTITSTDPDEPSLTVTVTGTGTP